MKQSSEQESSPEKTTSGALHSFFGVFSGLSTAFTKLSSNLTTGNLHLPGAPTVGAGKSIFNVNSPDKNIADAQISNSAVPAYNGSESAPTGDDIATLDLASQQLLLAIEKEPGNPSLHNQLGLIYAESGQSDKALQNFQKAIELARTQLTLLNAQEKAALSQKNSSATAKIVLAGSKLSNDLAAAHSSLARIYDKLGQHDRVVAELDMLNHDISFGSGLSPAIAAKTAREASPVHRLSSECLQKLARAEALSQANRLPEAMQLYKQVLKIDPQVGIAHEKLGLAAESSSNFWLAKQELQAALSLNPADANCNVHLGTVYQALSEPAKARAEFLKALNIDPKNTLALFNLANICASQNQVPEAIRIYQKLVAVSPSMPAAHNNLAMSYAMQHDYPHAIDEYGRALALEPDLASSHYGLGMALYNVKDYRASISELKRALALNPSYLDAREKIELAYRKLNDTSSSIAKN
ncbi:MAG: tetratricopeptide repeat protein [Candidatus Obscuribacterales bacterium]|nr:tetratricopeptide repeat protein [Candidatus Obscuribacterales bacterium]